ncbi:hypothetical protein PO002_38205 [Cupriavidus necator]
MDITMGTMKAIYRRAIDPRAGSQRRIQKSRLALAPAAVFAILRRCATP